MAVNSELIEIIKASQLPRIDNPTTGDLIHAQGDNLGSTSLSFFLDKINSGIYGTIKPDTVVPTTGYLKYDVKDPGTYSNLSPSISITQQELDDNFVYITVANGVADKLLSKKPNPKALEWEPKSYEIGRQAYRFGKLYEATENVLSTDIPGESDKWKDLIAENFITDGFSKRGAKEVDLLLHKSPIPGAYKIDNTTLVESTVASTFHNIDVANYDYLWIDFIPVYLEAPLKPEVKAIIGIKENGIIEVLEESHVTNNWWDIENQKRKAYDVRPYQYITINYQSNIAYSNMFRLVKGEINIKQYSDEARIAMSSFLGGLVDPSSPKYEYKKVTATNTPSVNGVSVLDQYLIGTDNGIMGPVSNDWGKFKTWYNIPLNNKEEKLRITEIVFNTGRIGGDYPSMVAVDAKGKITVLVPSQVPPLNKADNYVIDVTGYEFVSLVMNISTPELEAASYFTFNAKRYFESTDDIIKKYIDGKVSDVKVSGKVNTSTLLFLDKPTTIPVINIIGELPTDTSDARTPTNVILEYYINNQLIFSCKCEMSIQGNATAQMAKKGYEIKLTNFNGEKLSLQFGDWISNNSFHLKGFPHDRTFARDVVSSRIWHKIRTSRPFPASYIADFGNTNPDGSAVINTMEGALFYADGFPIEMRKNGNFEGVQVFRHKKEPRNYMFDDKNPNHIFLDSELIIDWTQYVAAQWKRRSPKTMTPATQDQINALFNWFKGIANGTIDFESTYNQYINIDSWVDFLLAQQLCTKWDTHINNMQIWMWNGKASLGYYDGDMDWFWATEGGVDDPPLIIDAQGLYWRGTFFRNAIYPKLKTRIQQRWTELRNNNIITTNYIYSLFKEINGVIPSSLIQADFAKWSDIPYGKADRQSVRYIMSLTGSRLSQLDAAWKI
ncbi:hypothetical protein CMU26_00920 [Elizabethkingia anophelis]|nr:hypothetical protein [Elizabethkingia anophelis]